MQMVILRDLPYNSWLFGARIYLMTPCRNRSLKSRAETLGLKETRPTSAGCEMEEATEALTGEGEPPRYLDYVGVDNTVGTVFGIS